MGWGDGLVQRAPILSSRRHLIATQLCCQACLKLASGINIKAAAASLLEETQNRGRERVRKKERREERGSTIETTLTETNGELAEAGEWSSVSSPSVRPLISSHYSSQVFSAGEKSSRRQRQNSPNNQRYTDKKETEGEREQRREEKRHQLFPNRDACAQPRKETI